MNYTSQIASGTVTVDTDAGTFSITGVVGASPKPPDPPAPPTPSGDAIDLSAAIITAQSPDVRGWPITAKLTAVYISPSVNDGPDASMNVDFTKRWGAGAWPFVPGSEGGDLQYTLWVGCQILGLWYFSGPILCISRGQNDNYVPTGPVMRQGQLPDNWYYYAGSPLAGYQPKNGEQVAWFITAGIQRRNDIHVVAERTQVVLTPFAPGTYTF
jgi:hypothetical protein